MTTPAVERIAFQHGSPLAHGLIAACAGFVQWAIETQPAAAPDGKLPKFNPYRLDQAMEYAKKTFVPAIIKLCKDELNLTIVPCYIEDIEYGAGMMASVLKTGKDTFLSDQDFFKGEALLSGQVSYRDEAFEPAALFRQLEADYDLAKGKLKKPIADYAVYLFVWPSVFLTRELFPELPVFSPEEQAAILSHEIGHALGFIEHMGDLYHRAELASMSVRYLRDHGTAENAKAAIKELTVAMERTKLESPELKRAVGDTGAILLGKTAIVLALILPFISFFMICYAILVFAASLARLAGGAQLGAINTQSNKTSDTVVTHSSVAYYERIADEFAARQGLAAPLASALAKIHTFYRDYPIASYAMRQMSRDCLIVRGTLTGISILYEVFGMLLNVPGGTYDPDWLRLERILQDHLVVFKDPKLTPALRDFYVKETQTLITAVETYKNAKGTRYRRLVWESVFRILARNSIVDAFTTANLSNDYDQLQILTEGLIKNRLFYHAARLDKLR